MKKQQTSLLSFFSPPSGSKPPTARPSASKTPTSTSKAKDATSRKRIDFSPKERTSVKTTKAASAVATKSSPTTAKTQKEEETPTKRKVYEDFLGTSSEEEEDGAPEKQNTSEKTRKTPTPPLKRLRRATTPRVVIKDDDDSDEEMPDATSKPAPAKPIEKASAKRNRRSVAARKIAESSEEEWQAGDNNHNQEEDESEFSADEETDDDDDDQEDEVDEEEEEEEEERPRKRGRATTKSSTPVKKTPTKPSFLSPRTPTKSPRTTSTPSLKKPIAASPSNASAAPAVPGAGVNGVYGAGCHLHDSFAWLHDQRRDINGNRPDSPEFDPRTLLVPTEFLKKETPAMVQWWDVKARNMDTVLFFKVGKFYELFHMDADIGFKELGLIYMKGEKAHSGFPEIAYSKMSSQLIEKGYRVARVEQTETPEMMKERNSTSVKKSKVVRREICSLLSAGTNTISFLDAPMASQSQVSRQLLALKEEPLSSGSMASTGGVRMGVCFVDSTTGAFHLGEFDDTEHRDRLKTLLAQYHVVEIVNERNGLSDATKQTLKHGAPSAVRSELRVGKEFWDHLRTVDEIERAGYFKESGWPDEVLAFLNIEKSVKMEGQLAISAFGGCIWHLRRSIIDQELVSLCNFQRYRPADEEAMAQRSSQDQMDAVQASKMELNQQYVVLDAQTIQNLEILTNNFNGARSGSLIDLLDKTVTSFGRRMFQEWVVKPLCKVAEINARLDAVEELTQSVEVVAEVRNQLRKLPDLERLLSRIHALGSVHRSKEHPDSRAIMYEANTYNIRKIRDFLAVLQGFETAMDLVRQYGARFQQFQSPILQQLLQKTADNGQFPDLSDKLAFFRHSFDQAAAQKSGVIVPQDGVDPDYDDACKTIENIEKEFDEYLQEQRQALRCKQIVYWGKKKEDRYQLEVPESAFQHLKQPKEYELKSKKKGYKRFHTPVIRDLLAQLAKAEDRKEDALKDQMRRVFFKFDQDYRHWMHAVQCLSVLDCLLSLAYVSSHNEAYVRPEIVSAAATNNGAPFIEIHDGVHPCVAASFESGDFIPNDTNLGLDRGKRRMMLLSGPNMGGKSTLLRQTCVLALMAQIGCFVPATKCRMTPVDRIFTRIGASDRILAGQSTLFVELAETATILNHASPHSLVILDELGRGTSTFDGTAIAYAVIEHLLRDVQCRTLFATHYHSLVEEYVDDDRVQLGHMGCLVDPENDKKVTFLYKLAEGMCPKSYGLNVAMLAKLPDQVIECAAKKSEQFEKALAATSHLQCEASQLVERVQQVLQQMQTEPTVDQEAQLQQLWQQAKDALRWYLAWFCQHLENSCSHEKFERCSKIQL